LRAGRNREALEAAIRSIEFDPSFPRARSVFGWAYLRNDMPAEGLAELERAVSMAPGNTMYLGQLGQAYAMVGREGDAEKILGQLKELSRERYVSPYHTAYVFTGLSNHDAAMDCLEQAYRERAGGTYGIKGSFLFAPLREHPRFKALLEKMNLS
jgi:tetratricopeptide (TPR) repeat protein